jgi:hypothetical protein
MSDTAASIAPAAHTKAGLDQAFGQLAKAGGWWTGSQRIAIAEEGRAARKCLLCGERKAALSPYSVSNSVSNQSHDSVSTLSAHTVDIIHRITTDPGRLSQRWYDEAISGGMRPEELVEITSIIGVVTVADTLSRALSLPERALPESLAGEPHRHPVSGTRIDRAWVPMVDPESAEGMLKMMYDRVESAAGFVFNVVRALTAVPEAVQDFFTAFMPNYGTHGDVAPGGLDRTQVELLASSTSDYNDCFY